MISQLIRPEIRKMEPIAWGDIPEEAPGRLLWGENPLVIKELRPALVREIARINRYPTPTQKNLKTLIARYNNVKPENIIVTNGSDDALELIAKVFINNQDEVVFPIPTFPVYESVSLMMGAKILTVPLGPDFSLSLNALAKIISKKTKIVWVANPNNPTGNILLQPDEIARLARRLNGVLVIDECYFETSGMTAVSLIKNLPNVLIVRSFSKIFGLAGVRLGYIAANKEISDYLSRVQNNNQAFAVNRFSIAAGTAVLADPKIGKMQLRQFGALKRQFEQKLLGVPGIEVIPTVTTFCLIRLIAANLTSLSVKRELEKRYQIYVKDCSIYKTLGSNCLYLGIPKPEYQKTVTVALKAILAPEGRI